MIKKRLDSGCLKKISILEIQFWYSQLDLDLMTLTMLDLKKNCAVFSFWGGSGIRRAVRSAFGLFVATPNPSSQLEGQVAPAGEFPWKKLRLP